FTMLRSGACPPNPTRARRRWRWSWKASPSPIRCSKTRRSRSLWTAASSRNWTAKAFSPNFSEESDYANDAERNADVACDIFHPGFFLDRAGGRCKRGFCRRAARQDQSDAGEIPRGGAGKRSAQGRRAGLVRGDGERSRGGADQGVREQISFFENSFSAGRRWTAVGTTADRAPDQKTARRYYQHAPLLRRRDGQSGRGDSLPHAAAGGAARRFYRQGGLRQPHLRAAARVSLQHAHDRARQGAAVFRRSARSALEGQIGHGHDGLRLAGVADRLLRPQ